MSNDFGFSQSKIFTNKFPTEWNLYGWPFWALKFSALLRLSSSWSLLRAPFKNLLSAFPLCKVSLLLKWPTLSSVSFNISYLLSFRARWSYISWLTLWRTISRQYIILMKVLITARTCKQTHTQSKSKTDIFKKNNYPISFLLPCVLYIMCPPTLRR